MLTREQNAAFKDEIADGRIGAFKDVRKAAVAPSPWEANPGKFVRKAAVLASLEKRGENDDYAVYANYATGERLFVNKATGEFVYDNPGFGMPRQGVISEFDVKEDVPLQPLVSKGEQINLVKKKA